MKIKGALLGSFALLAFTSCRADATPPGDSGVSPAVVQAPAPSSGRAPVSARNLFLKNCAHCHGADARGDEGPDLHQLGRSDGWISNRIRNGKPGEMTAFARRLQPAEITALVGYLRTLK